MSVLVGYSPEARGRGGLELAAMLARSSGDRLIVCCVVPDRWETPSMARVDKEYADHLKGLAGAALADAKEILGDDVGAEYVVRTGRSVPTVLVNEADARDARVLVLGSSSHGSWGHIALGSVTDRLLHSAQLPIALAPRGFRAPKGLVVRRVTVALNGTPSCGSVLVDAARVTREVAADLRVVTFAVRGRTMYPPELGLRAEDLVMQAWREQAAAMQHQAIEALADEDDVSQPAEVGIVEGRDWGDALERVAWDEGDVLVIGSSPQGLVARVFLGSTATRILRHSPVPVVLLPAGGGIPAPQTPKPR
jgi:nucleotide-binding universal stress UspA family protein